MPAPRGYTQVVETTGPGRTVYLSGQLGMTAGGAFAGPPGDFRAQATQCFENLKAGLESVGARLRACGEDHQLLRRHVAPAAVLRMLDKFVNTKAPPASTAIQVGAPGARRRAVRSRGGCGHSGQGGEAGESQTRSQRNRRAKKRR